MAYYNVTDHEYTLDQGATWTSCIAEQENGDGTVSIPVGDVEKSAGTVGVRVKSAAGRNASPILWNDAPFTVGLTVIMPLTADYAYTVYDKDATNYRKRSAFAQVAVRTDAPQLTIKFYSPLAFANYINDAIISIYDENGEFVDKITPDAVDTEQTKTTNFLPGTGFRNFYLVEGGSTQVSAVDFKGTHITSIQATSGHVGVLKQDQRANRVIALGDSIAIGDGATNNSRYGWPIILRSLLDATWGITTDAWGVRSHQSSLSAEIWQQEQADRIVNHMAGATGRKVVLWALGTNDFGVAASVPADVATYAASVWDKVNAADPDIEIILVTPLWRGNKDTANSAGYVLADYATALTNAASTRAWITVNSGLPILGMGDFTADNLHPNDTGHQKLARHMHSFITGEALPTIIQAGETVQENDYRITYSGTWTYNDEPTIPEGGENPFIEGAIKYTTNNTAYAEIPFNGTQIQFKAYMEKGAGNFRLLIDGTLVGIYTQYSLNTVLGNVVNSPILSAGQHLARIEKDSRVTGSVYLDQITIQNSTATPTESFSVVDRPRTGEDGTIPTGFAGIVQGERVSDNNDPNGKIRYTGTYTTYSNTLFESSSIKYSNTSGDFYEFDIYGQQFRLGYHLDVSGGLWDIYVDDVLLTTIDTRASAAGATETVKNRFYVSSVLTLGVHKITVRQNTPTGPRAIWFDYAEVLWGTNNTVGTNY